MTTTAFVSGVETPSSTIATAAWTYDPWREHPRTALLAAVCALGLCALVVAARLPFVMAAALMLFCVASFTPALAPVACELSSEGACRRGPFGTDQRAWARVRRVEVLPAAVLLSPYATRSWLDAQRGLTLPLPASRRAELLATIARLSDADGR